MSLSFQPKQRLGRATAGEDPSLRAGRQALKALRKRSHLVLLHPETFPKKTYTRKHALWFHAPQERGESKRESQDAFPQHEPIAAKSVKRTMKLASAAQSEPLRYFWGGRLASAFSRKPQPD